MRGGAVGRHPRGPRAFAVERLARVEAEQRILVEERRAGRDERGRIGGVRVRHARGLEEIDPGAGHREVKLLGVSLARGEPAHAIRHLPERGVPPVPREIHEREPHVIGVVELGQRPGLEAGNQLVVCQHVNPDSPIANPVASA